MIIRTLKSLSELTAPIVLGPWTDIQLPERATLKILEETAEIQSNGTTLQVPLIEDLMSNTNRSSRKKIPQCAFPSPRIFYHTP